MSCKWKDSEISLFLPNEERRKKGEKGLLDNDEERKRSYYFNMTDKDCCLLTFFSKVFLLKSTFSAA